MGVFSPSQMQNPIAAGPCKTDLAKPGMHHHAAVDFTPLPVHHHLVHSFLAARQVFTDCSPGIAYCPDPLANVLPAKRVVFEEVVPVHLFGMEQSRELKHVMPFKLLSRRHHLITADTALSAQGIHLVEEVTVHAIRMTETNAEAETEDKKKMRHRGSNDICRRIRISHHEEAGNYRLKVPKYAENTPRIRMRIARMMSRMLVLLIPGWRFIITGSMPSCSRESSSSSG